MATLREVRQETQGRISELLSSTGAFYAFSQEQYKAKAVEGVEYCVALGIVVPKAKATTLVDQLNAIIKDSRAKELATGREALIHYELCNHECYYVADIADAVDVLKPYGITEEEVLSVYTKRVGNYY